MANGKPAAPRARPYKDFLTPALHRCFTNAALIGLGTCWIEAIVMSKPSLVFWSWFPLSLTGIRTGLLFVSSLTVFVLRVAQIHVGTRTNSSFASSVWSVGLNKRTFWTIVWYWVSAFLFSETYIFSTADKANLAWIDPGRTYERPRLNERAVLLRTVFGILAVAQGFLHVYGDYDSLKISQPSPESTGRRQDASGESNDRKAPTPLSEFKAEMQSSVIQSFIKTILVGIWGPILYFSVLRGWAWSVARTVGRAFFTINKSQSPAGLTDVFALFGRYMVSAFMLVFMWQMTNLAFTVYARQSPLKKGQPLTNDSKHPNGSLVSGLKAKKDIPHSMALWELRLIAEQFEDRRRTIYNDFEKPGASTWLDIAAACLAEIERVSKSIQTAQAPTTTHAEIASNTEASTHKARLTQPLQEDDNIFRPARKAQSAAELVADGTSAVAKYVGQSPGGNQLASKVRSYLASPAGQEQFSPQRITGLINQCALKFLRTWIGSYFCVPFAQRMNAIVFGSPYSNAADVHNATRALSRLAVKSLTEDPFGQVQKDVGRIMRALMNTIRDLHTLTRTLEPHWTDVHFDGKRSSPEVEELLVTLEESLESIITNFGEYISALGISRQELQSAKNLVGRGQEMIKRS
ncbi:hypothetical protein K461DRAFT_258999 [Myriangium duriaei CBS 260.36]|uniref:Nucleoporin NDC1 n=1 Tax=Myriangium duriaei CBS 260.36 TaxID=1168546 RepID=A0A9P4IXB6_9PEZI|nr:hypothetical protein K461DRAFT_258999 [Myriangium duriaei CBS 260.36]